jgi:hypothetical protein
MAVIGNAKAVAHIKNLEIGGFLAWLMWGVVHILFLIGFRNRVVVLLSWFWNWLLKARDARLITGAAQLEIDTPRPSGFVAYEASPGEQAAVSSSVSASKALSSNPRPPTSAASTSHL